MSKLTKITHMVDEIGFDASVLLCLQKISKFKSASSIEEALGITERQATRLSLDLAESLLESLLRNMETRLLHDESIEFPKQFVVAIKRSKVRMDDEGQPLKRLTIRTRKALKNQMTGGTK